MKEYLENIRQNNTQIYITLALQPIVQQYLNAITYNEY